jgi:hypothetical protein
MIEKDKKSPPKVEVKPRVVAHENKKKTIEENNFKLSKFKNVESKIKDLIHP